MITLRNRRVKILNRLRRLPCSTSLEISWLAMMTQLLRQLVSLYLFVLLRPNYTIAGTALDTYGPTSAFTTRYWDCCKPSCAWNDHGEFKNSSPVCLVNYIRFPPLLNLQAINIWYRFNHATSITNLQSTHHSLPAAMLAVPPTHAPPTPHGLSTTHFPTVSSAHS